jgi:hypothetical protein
MLEHYGSIPAALLQYPFTQMCLQQPAACGNTMPTLVGQLLVSSTMCHQKRIWSESKHCTVTNGRYVVVVDVKSPMKGMLLLLMQGHQRQVCCCWCTVTNGRYVDCIIVYMLTLWSSSSSWTTKSIRWGRLTSSPLLHNELQGLFNYISVTAAV